MGEPTGERRGGERRLAAHFHQQENHSRVTVAIELAICDRACRQDADEKLYSERGEQSGELSHAHFPLRSSESPAHPSLALNIPFAQDLVKREPDGI